MPRNDSRVVSNVFWLYGLQGLNYVVPAALLPYLVRTLGVEQYGLIAFAQAFAQYFILATDYGFNFSATRSIAKSREDASQVSRIFWTVIVIKMLLVLLGAVVLELILKGVPRFHQDRFVYWAAYGMVVGNAIFPLWLFQGIEQMRSISIFTGLGRLVSALLVVTFVKSPSDTLLATSLLSLGFVFAGVLGMIVALRKHVSGLYLPSRLEIFKALKEGRHLFITTAAVSLYSNTNTFLVGVIGGVEQAGYFSLADKLIRAISGVIAPLIQGSYPHVILLIAEAKPRAITFIRRALAAALIGGVLFGAILASCAPSLAILAFSHQVNSTAVRLLQVLALFPSLAAINYILGVLTLIPFGFDRAQSRLLLALGGLNVLLGVFLISRLGAIGGVATMMITESLQTVGSILILTRGGVNILQGPVPSQVPSC